MRSRRSLRILSTSASTRSLKIARERLAEVAGELLDHQPHRQEPLEPLAEPLGEEAADPEPAVEKIGGAERQRKGEPRLGGALVAEPAVGARAFDHRVGVAQQLLHHGGRSRAGGERLHHDRALLIAERDQRHPDAIVLREPDPADRPPGGGLLHPDLIRRERARGRGRIERMIDGGLADQPDRLGVGDFEHPVAQHLVGRRQPVEPERADDHAQRRAVDEQGEEHEAGRRAPRRNDGPRPARPGFRSPTAPARASARRAVRPRRWRSCRRC